MSRPPHSVLSFWMAIIYASSFFVPAVSNVSETWYGFHCFRYAAIPAFPVWLANPLFLIGVACLAMANWKGATIFGVLSSLAAALGVVVLVYAEISPHIGFILWGTSCVALAVVRLIALSVWPGIET